MSGLRITRRLWCLPPGSSFGRWWLASRWLSLPCLLSLSRWESTVKQGESLLFFCFVKLLVKSRFHLQTTFFFFFLLCLNLGRVRSNSVYYSMSVVGDLSCRQWRWPWVLQRDSVSETGKDEGAFGVLCVLALPACVALPQMLQSLYVPTDRLTP